MASVGYPRPVPEELRIDLDTPDESGLSAIERTVARDEIRQLAYRYAQAIDRRDADLMVSLYTPTARFGSYGEGHEALRALTIGSLEGIGLAVLLIGNHVIDFADPHHATGQVWCRGYIDDHAEGFIEQMIRYDDRYVYEDGKWLFVSRKHILWYGVRTAEHPMDQEPANWPQRQVGTGTANDLLPPN